MKHESFWEGRCLTLERFLELTTQSLHAYGPPYCHWAIAYRGGKDSSTVGTVVTFLLASGIIQNLHVSGTPPSMKKGIFRRVAEKLTMLYADTRVELPPLQATAWKCCSATMPHQCGHCGNCKRR